MFEGANVGQMERLRIGLAPGSNGELSCTAQHSTAAQQACTGRLVCLISSDVNYPSWSALPQH